MKATRAAPSSGVVDHFSSKISGARITGTSTWTANITGATWVAGRRCRALISLSSASPSEAARGGQPGHRDQQRPRRQLVGQQLAGDRRPGVAEAGAEDGEQAQRGGPAAQHVGSRDRDRHQAEGERDRQRCRRGRWCGRAPPRRRPRPRRRSPPRRRTRACPGASPSLRRPEPEQHDQPADQARLHHRQRRQQQRHDLQRPAQQPQRRRPQPLPVPHQLPDQRDPQRVLVRHIPRLQRLQRDRGVVEDRGPDRRGYPERQHGATLSSRARRLSAAPTPDSP